MTCLTALKWRTDQTLIRSGAERAAVLPSAQAVSSSRPPVSPRGGSPGGVSTSQQQQQPPLPPRGERNNNNSSNSSNNVVVPSLNLSNLNAPAAAGGDGIGGGTLGTLPPLPADQQQQQPQQQRRGGAQQQGSDRPVSSLFQYGMNLLKDAYNKDDEAEELTEPRENASGGGGDDGGFPGFRTPTPAGGAPTGTPQSLRSIPGTSPRGHASLPDERRSSLDGGMGGGGAGAGINHRSQSSGASNNTFGGFDRAGSGTNRGAKSDRSERGERGGVGVTPVLESVLGKITQEYERRLLMKENELVRARDQLTEAFRREGRLTQHRDELSDEINTLTVKVGLYKLNAVYP
jgi:hypothetical protein